MGKLVFSMALGMCLSVGVVASQDEIFSDGFEMGSSWAWSTTRQVVMTVPPYQNLLDVGHISRVFCMSGACPWDPPDQLHDGLDFHPTHDLVPFQAVSSGVVSAVDAFLNAGNGFYQVNVIVVYDNDSRYGLVYAFEPMSADPVDRDLQLANIAVLEGSVIAPGDLIGNLLQVDIAAAHVHFGFLDQWTQICPEPFMAEPVQTEILNLIHQDHAGWNMCY